MYLYICIYIIFIQSVYYIIIIITSIIVHHHLLYIIDYYNIILTILHAYNYLYCFTSIFIFIYHVMLFGLCIHNNNVRFVLSVFIFMYLFFELNNFF